MVNDTAINNLFGNFRYELDPILQRSYEWKEERAVEFINDICNVRFTSYRGSNCRYNIGDIMTYRKSEDGKVKYLCDGQQRLPTLVLLFANIYHHRPSSERVVDGLEDILYTYERSKNGDREKVNRLELKDSDNKILNKIIKSGPDEINKEESKHRLVKVYNKISKMFTEEKNKDELNDLYHSIYENTSYFERECESQTEAIKQFNNLNGGQQKISNTRQGLAELYRIYNDGSYEKDIEHFLDELSNIPEKETKEYLCLYLNYRDYECRESDIPDDIKQLKLVDDDLLNNMFDFYNQIYVEKFKNRKVPFSDKTSLRQAWVDLYTDKYPSMKDIDTSEKDKAYRKCEWGYICNRILRRGTGDKNLLYRMFNDFNPDCERLSTYVVSYLRNKDLYGTVDIIDSYKREKGNKGNDLYLNLLLRAEEQYQIDLGCKEAINHISNPTLEHIHPQTPRTDKEYQCDDSFTNNLGNMTIIGGKANSSLSNKVFKEKIEDYKKSPYYINSHHLAKYDHWDGETVNNNKMFYFVELKKYYGL